jgi:LacI family transcriptional regulator
MGDERSGRIATEHLIALGHQRIGFIAGSEDYSLSQRRITGWQKAMAAAGFAQDGLMVRGDFSYDSGVAAAEELLARADRPTAIIASNDQMALAVLDTATKRELSVPQALSLVSFDNSPVTRFTDPQLTAIDQPIAATFSKAVELLITNGSGPTTDQPVVIESSLIERGSTAPPGGHDGN